MNLSITNKKRPCSVGSSEFHRRRCHPTLGLYYSFYGLIRCGYYPAQSAQTLWL